MDPDWWRIYNKKNPTAFCIQKVNFIQENMQL